MSVPPAMIFAAGLGTRMGDLTQKTPKPLIEVMGVPLVDYAINYLREARVTHVVANTHYLSDQLAPHLESRDVVISDESARLLDTGGGLKAALPLIAASPVITLNSDAIFVGPPPIERLVSAWTDDMEALLLMVPLDRAVGRQGSGDFDLDNGHVARGTSYVYTGAQIIRTERLADFDEAVFSLNRLWDALLSDGTLNAAVYSGRWCDIGHPEGLLDAERLLRSV